MNLRLPVKNSYARWLVLVCLACTAAWPGQAAPVAQVRFATGQEAFEISSVTAGTQTVTLASAAGEVQWVDIAVKQTMSRGQYVLSIPVSPGEVVVAAKPQTLADGTHFVFLKVSAAAPAGGAGLTIASVNPAPPPSSAPTSAPATPPPVTLTPQPAPAPPRTVLAATPAASTGTSGEAPPSAAELTANANLKAAVEKFLPSGLKFDPLPKADFAIPESPGAAVLDQTAQILKPAAPRETMTSLLSHFDGNGALNSGFSIAVTPYTMLRKKPVTLADYSDPKNPWVRFMTRLQVSLAAKTGAAPSGGTAPALFGVGLSGVFFDDSDPRMDNTLFTSLSNLFSTSPQVDDATRADIYGGEVRTLDPVPQSKLDAFAKITAAAQKARWNAPAASFGYAMRLNSASGKVEDAKEDGGAAWLNYSRPGFGSLDENSQFLFTASYRYHDAFTRDGVTGVEDTFNLAAQLRFGTRDFSGFAQAAHHWRKPKSLPKFSETTIEIGLEKKVMDGLWLNLGWSNDESLGGDSIIKTGLRYGFGEAATLGNGQ